MSEQRQALDALAEKYPVNVEIQAARIKFYAVYVRDECAGVRDSYLG